MSFMPPNQAGYEASAAQTREAEAKAEHYAQTHPDRPRRPGPIGRLLQALRRLVGRGSKRH